MKMRLALGLVLIAACDQVALPGLPGSAATQMGGGNDGGRTEFLVLGSNMSFDDCRTRGGFIIHDQGSNMYACDPKVRRQPVPVDEFNHPQIAPSVDLRTQPAVSAAVTE